MILLLWEGFLFWNMKAGHFSSKQRRIMLDKVAQKEVFEQQFQSIPIFSHNLPNFASPQPPQIYNFTLYLKCHLLKGKIQNPRDAKQSETRIA
jgi:hypothetical protein